MLSAAARRAAPSSTSRLIFIGDVRSLCNEGHVRSLCNVFLCKEQSKGDRAEYWITLLRVLSKLTWESCWFDSKLARSLLEACSKLGRSWLEACSKLVHGVMMLRASRHAHGHGEQAWARLSRMAQQSMSMAQPLHRSRFRAAHFMLPNKAS